MKDQRGAGRGRRRKFSFNRACAHNAQGNFDKAVCRRKGSGVKEKQKNTPGRLINFNTATPEL